MEQGDYVLEVQRHEVARQSLLLRPNKSQSNRAGFCFEKIPHRYFLQQSHFW